MENTENIELNYCYNCMKQLDAGQSVCPDCGYDNSVNHNPPIILPEGTMLAGKYVVGRALDRDEFGIPYVGLNISLGLRVAIKECFPQGLSLRAPNTLRVMPSSARDKTLSFQQVCDEFQAKAQILAQLNSQYFVKILDNFRENGTAYVVMLYPDGRSLTEELKANGGKMPWRRVTELFDPLIQELDKLHRTSMNHLNITTDSIRVVREQDGSERAVLLDFGSAWKSDIYDAGSDTALAFMPVEQFARKVCGPYTDVYALCGVMYTAITGTLLPGAVERLNENAPLRTFAEMGLKDVPQRVEKAIRHGLELQAEDRPQSMDILWHELNDGSDRDGQDQLPAAPVKDGQDQLNGAPEKDGQNQLYYEAGKKLMSFRKLEGYQQAQELFEEIPGWRDADALAETCDQESYALSRRQTLLLIPVTVGLAAAAVYAILKYFI